MDFALVIPGAEVECKFGGFAVAKGKLNPAFVDLLTKATSYNAAHTYCHFFGCISRRFSSCCTATMESRRPGRFSQSLPHGEHSREPRISVRLNSRSLSVRAGSTKANR
ncbi:hypothetical protein J3459_006632 [Metarhizium acridum]|nr:hypothetical protein J3459_006632 [Metarhizium acridum]